PWANASGKKVARLLELSSGIQPTQEVAATSCRSRASASLRLSNSAGRRRCIRRADRASNRIARLACVRGELVRRTTLASTKLARQFFNTLKVVHEFWERFSRLVKRAEDRWLASITARCPGTRSPGAN